MFSERRGRRALHPNIQQLHKPEYDPAKIFIIGAKISIVFGFGLGYNERENRAARKEGLLCLRFEK